MNIKIRLLMALVSVVFSGMILASPIGWRNEIIIINPDQQHTFGHPSIVTGPDNKINVILRKLESADPRCYETDIYQSTNTGVAWIYRENYGNVLPVADRSTDIVRTGNYIYAVYQGVGNNYQDSIYYSKSTNGGDSWPPAPSVITQGIHPKIGIDGNNLHLIYSFKPDASGYEIYRRQSTNGGANWSGEQRLTVANRNSWHPAVSVNANAIHLIWADNRGIDPQNYEIYYDKSTDHGVTWIYGGTYGYQFAMDLNVSEYPDVVAYTDPNNQAVHVVWMDDKQLPGPGVYYRRSTDNGSSWTDAVRLLESGHHPSIAADSRGLYVVCEKDVDILYIESTNYGASWNSPVNITNSPNRSDSFPDIHADEMGRHVVFSRPGDIFGFREIYYIQRDIVVPSAPLNLRKDPLCVPPPVALLWNANSEPDLYDYRVYRRLLPVGKWAIIGTSKNPNYTDNTVSGGNWYEYYVTARDLALNESPTSNVIQVYIPEPKKIVDLGLPEPSAYTLERSGYYQWGGTPDSTADYGNALRYRLTGFIPENDYALGFVLFEPAYDSGRAIGLRSGNVPLDSLISVPDSALCLSFRLPASVYSQGKIDLTLAGRNRNAVLSQILIWERARGGTQSMGSDIENGDCALNIYPNPASGSAEIRFVLNESSPIRLTLYDAAGKLVRVMDLGTLNAGNHSYSLGKDITKTLPNGIYFVELSTDNVTARGRWVIWK